MANLNTFRGNFIRVLLVLGCICVPLLYFDVFTFKIRRSTVNPYEYDKDELLKKNTEVQLSILPIKSIINVPTWYRNSDWGLEKNASFENVNEIFDGSDKEAETGWYEFFFSTTKGLMLEMGAMAGKKHSVSLFFEQQAKWRTILIEGNPNLASHLSENRPNSLNFNLVVCDKPKRVHFTLSGGSGDGILEYMENGLLRAAFPSLVTNGILDYGKLENNKLVKSVQCLPLADILVPLEITHINFFLLDVEGGELNILKAIDFDQITFDVMIVETDRGYTKPEITASYVDAVIELVTSKGYKLWKRKLGRNSWFVSPTFQPFKKM